MTDIAAEFTDGLIGDWQIKPENRAKMIAVVEDLLAIAREEGRRAAISTPETSDFIAGIALEAAHQVERWGPAHDRGKSAENWFWLVGYLAGKALRAAIEGDTEKALHHTISAAAACANWHAALKAHGDKGDDRDLVEIARFDSNHADLPKSPT